MNGTVGQGPQVSSLRLYLGSTGKHARAVKNWFKQNHAIIML